MGGWLEAVYGNFDIIFDRSPAFSPLACTRCVDRALLGARADHGLIGAWNPMA